MITSGAAGALLSGTAGLHHRHGSEGDPADPRPHRPQERSHHPEVAPLRLRPCRPHQRRPAGRGGDGGATGSGDQPEDRHDAVLQRCRSQGPDPRRAEFVAIAKKHGIPTLNDAAADVPPVEHFSKYTKMGFDLVAFSGGKGIRGPQSAGLLLGRKDLIAAARLNSSPNSDSIARSNKVNKEEMLGMMVAVELLLQARPRSRVEGVGATACRRSPTSSHDIKSVSDRDVDPRDREPRAAHQDPLGSVVMRITPPEVVKRCARATLPSRPAPRQPRKSW